MRSTYSKAAAFKETFVETFEQPVSFFLRDRSISNTSFDKGFLEGRGFGLGGPHGRGGHLDAQSDTPTAPTVVPTTAP